MPKTPFANGLPVAAAAIFATALSGLAPGALASDSRWEIGVETGAAWQNKNDVQIPGDTGTRFSLHDLAGDGPFGAYRVELFYDVAPRHQVRLLAAPLGYTEDGVLDGDVRFDDATFTAGQATKATYRFNSYRATYRYLFYDDAGWRWWIGATANIRDAEIALRQDGVSASDSNVGFVPLLNLYGDLRLATNWRLIVDFDGLVAPQGRALDLGLKVYYDFSPNWYVGAGYRVLEGGVDNDDVYNFAWFNYAMLSVGYSF